MIKCHKVNLYPDNRQDEYFAITWQLHIGSLQRVCKDISGVQESKEFRSSDNSLVRSKANAWIDKLLKSLVPYISQSKNIGFSRRGRKSGISVRR